MSIRQVCHLFGLGEFTSKIRMSDYFLNEMTTYSSISPLTEEPSRLQSVGSQESDPIR